jgi:hypothetical protein
MPQFTYTPLPATATPEATNAAFDSRIASAVSDINTVNDQQALLTEKLFGIGSITGCGLSVVGDVLRMADGYFLAGPGVADTDDPTYFIGARLKQVLGAGAAGHIEITGDDAPPLNAAAGVFGYMSWYGDVVWFTTEQMPRPDGRWQIGKVITDASGSVSVVADTADLAPSIASHELRIKALEDAGPGGDGPAYDDTAIRGQIADLYAQISALTAGAGDTDDVENPSDIISTDFMRMESFLVQQYPAYALTSRTSLDQPRYAGYGQLLDGGAVSPNIDGGGNAIVDFEDNSIHG